MARKTSRQLTKILRDHRVTVPAAQATFRAAAVPGDKEMCIRDRIEGVLMVGGYAMSGDSVLDATANEFTVLKAGAAGYAVLRA